MKFNLFIFGLLCFFNNVQASSNDSFEENLYMTETASPIQQNRPTWGFSATFGNSGLYNFTNITSHTLSRRVDATDLESGNAEKTKNNRVGLPTTKMTITGRNR